MRVYCSPYTEDIESFVNQTFSLNKKILHIVPTLILYRRRRSFYIRHVLRPYLPKDFKQLNEKQSNKEINKYVSLFEMDQFLKNGIYNSNQRILSKSESSILLERVLKEHEETNNLAWTSITNELLSLFFELSESGLSIEELKYLQKNKQWELIINIYEYYIDKVKEENALDIGLGSSLILDTLDLSEYEELILDGGFLPILPKHHRLIKRFSDMGKSVKFLIPFDKQNLHNPALGVLKTVYDPYVPFNEWDSIQRSSRPSSFFINRLPKKIFSENKNDRLDRTMDLLKFSTIEEELNYIIQKISVLVKNGLADPKEIAIVTPNPMEMRPLVREISELYGLSVELPERPLLHLPKGRAIKTLIDAFVDQRKFENDYYIDLKMVKDIVQSNLIKTPTVLSDLLDKLEAFFEDATIHSHWYMQIEALITSKQQVNPIKNKFHPLLEVEIDQLASLKEFIECIENFSVDLFNMPDQTVSDHTKSLINFLLNHPQLNFIEDEILEKISSINSTIEAQANIKISSLEFGKRISSFFLEPEDEEIFTQKEKGKTKKEVLVTGPSNIEFQRYQYIFLCRFSQDMYPEPHQYKWPLNHEIERNLLNKATILNFDSNRSLEFFYLNRALYHFYLVLNSVTKQLVVSYSELKDGIKLSHAHYLHDISKVFGIEEGDRLDNPSLPKLEELLERYKVLKKPVEFSLPVDDTVNIQEKNSPLQVNSFSIEDLTVSKFCPKRFYYEKSYPKERIYKDNYHLLIYASATLYEYAVKEMVNRFPEITAQIDIKKTYNTLINNIPNFTRSAEQNVKSLFPLSRRRWQDVRARTEFSLSTLIGAIFDNQYIREQKSHGNNNVKIKFSIAETPVSKIYKNFTVHGLRDLEVHYNSKVYHRYSISNFKDFLSFSSRSDENERVKETKRWYFDTKRQFCKQDQPLSSEIKEMIDEITAGHFPKVSGGHCIYCNFNKLCKRKEVSNIADFNDRTDRSN